MTGEDLRVAIHAHLRKYPGLTAFEIARALGLPHPAGGGSARVRCQLTAMRHDGEATGEAAPRFKGDARPTVRWRAT